MKLSTLATNWSGN